MNECPDCQDTRRKFTMKLIFTNRQDFTYPKFIPQIKESCFACGRYIRFTPQTPELIEEFNKQLKEIEILL